ncbi:MAG: hypothetical protein HUU25_02980 [Candidatus Sumerlaeia bacterium]|nr:hypothetical protein [Candidatus Sumerlaeia bacterium]
MIPKVDKWNSADPAPCCVHLRCKAIYYRGDERPGLLRWTNSVGYWCLKTSDGVGPDGHVARHPNCQQGRGCFEAAKRI